MHETDLVLPFNLTEATLIISGYKCELSLVELLALWMRQLDKYSVNIQCATAAIKRAQLESKAKFKQQFQARILRYPLKSRTLVLVQNSRHNAGLTDKSVQQYLGPY